MRVLLRVPVAQRPQAPFGLGVDRLLLARGVLSSLPLDPGEEAGAEPGGFEAVVAGEVDPLGGVLLQVEEVLGIVGAAAAVPHPPLVGEAGGPDVLPAPRLG